MVNDERINQLKEDTALAWERAYGFEKTFGYGSSQYMCQVARACAYRDALEIVTGLQWYYNSTHNDMRVCD